MVYSTMDMIFEQGTVYGSRYYIARISYGGGKWTEMRQWCVDTLGPSPKDGVFTPGARWYDNDSAFWFRNLEDRNWFILRWQ